MPFKTRHGRRQGRDLVLGDAPAVVLPLRQ